MINNANVGLPTSSIMTGLLTQRRKSEFNKMSSQLFLKETEEGKYYRLRLLNTTPNQKFVTTSSIIGIFHSSFSTSILFGLIFQLTIQTRQSAFARPLSALRQTM